MRETDRSYDRFKISEPARKSLNVIILKWKMKNYKMESVENRMDKEASVNKRNKG